MALLNLSIAVGLTEILEQLRLQSQWMIKAVLVIITSGIDQIVTSDTTSIKSMGNIPQHDMFIIAPSNPYDWRSPQNDSLWSGSEMFNNPCPQDWSVFTDLIWQLASNTWAYNFNAFMDTLKLPSPSFRSGENGTYFSPGQRSIGNY